ncbi:MAG: hypothetical protein U5R46_19855 [Gammaproteobacteria bacterium]|nr:hypothetical protein [Gammaproteobacteria bacterium]
MNRRIRNRTYGGVGGRRGQPRLLPDAFQYRDDAERFYKALPRRLEKFGLRVAPDKTRILRFSRFHPGLRRRFAFLGFELYWDTDRQGNLRVMRRTARKTLQRAKRRMKDWVRANRHLPGRQFVLALNRKLVGHYNYFGLRGNQQSLHGFYRWVLQCAFKWLNRRGGKRCSFRWSQFNKALAKLGVAFPRNTERQREHVVFV